jgi:hypothetical protein
MKFHFAIEGESAVGFLDKTLLSRSDAKVLLLARYRQFRWRPMSFTAQHVAGKERPFDMHRLAK